MKPKSKKGEFAGVNQKLSKFALAVLGVNEPEHHKSIRKCLSCCFLNSCEYKVC